MAMTRLKFLTKFVFRKYESKISIPNSMTSKLVLNVSCHVNCFMGLEPFKLKIDRR